MDRYRDLANAAMNSYNQHSASIGAQQASAEQIARMQRLALNGFNGFSVFGAWGPPPTPPGIYWRRTSGRTWRVEIVR